MTDSTTTSTVQAPSGTLIKSFLPGVVLGFVLGVVGTFVVLTLSERPSLNIDVDPSERVTVTGDREGEAAPSVADMTEEEIQALLEQQAEDDDADAEEPAPE